MWTTANRARYNRDKLRYPSDMTEEEWAVDCARIPPARRGGRKRTVNIREVFNGVLYILSTGCQWRAIPTDLPPRSTLFHYLAGWEAEGTLRRIQAVLYGQCREQAGRGGSPTAGYPRPSEGEEHGKRGRGVDPSGYAAGKQGKGKKRHVLVDTLGLVLQALVSPANVQERDGGSLLFASLGSAFPYWRSYSWMERITGRSFSKRWPQSARSCRSRSSPEVITSKALSCFPNAGVWNARWHG